jgi:hypothetical protein
MMTRAFGSVFVAALLFVPGANASWNFVSAQRYGRPVVPVATGSVRIDDSSYSVLGGDVIPYLRSICQCYVETGDFPGPYSLTRTTRDGDPSSEFVTFSGPLSVLGSARISGGRRVAVFRKPDFFVVLASSSNRKNTLWDTALSEIALSHAVVTPDAMITLDGVIRDAEDAATSETGLLSRDSIDSTRGFMRTMINSGRSSDGIFIDTMQVRAAAVRWCLYPFCRKAR